MCFGSFDYQAIANEEFDKTLSNEQALYSSSYAKNSVKLKSQYSDVLDLVGLGLGLNGSTIGDNKTKNIIKETISTDQDMMSLMTYMLGINSASVEVDKLYKVEQLVDRKTDVIQGALISMHPTTGYIQAMIGGKDFSVANQFNRATQARRQMGSTFKPFLFSIALDDKVITPSEIFVDEIISYDGWTPRNYNGSYLGPMTVRRALNLSVNIVTIKIWERMLDTQIGYPKVIEKLSMFFGEENNSNFRQRIPNEKAAALGTGNVSPLSMARGFSAFINGGKTVEPISILKVYDRYGRLLDDFQLHHSALPKKSIISEETSFLMQNMLNDIIRTGTGSGAANRARYKYVSSTGGKTGTSDNWTDAWFAGFTENTSTVIWVGLDSSSKSLGRGRSGGIVAAPTWFSYMNRIGDLERPPALPFARGNTGLDSAFVSKFTGLLTTAGDPNGYTEYFLRGTRPQTYGNPDDIAHMQAQLAQADNTYTVTGESIDLSTQNAPENIIVNEDPYLLGNHLVEDLDLSFDLSSGL